jgi:non-ribosomal peptide synthetase component F
VSSLPVELRTRRLGRSDEAQTLPTRTLLESFGAQVEKTPNAIAVIFEEESVTYTGLAAVSSGSSFDNKMLGLGADT